MQVQFGGLGVVGLGLLALTFSVVAVGHATWAMSTGASPDDLGILTHASRMNTSRHRPGIRISLGTQQKLGGVVGVLGLVATVGGLVVPLMLGSGEE